MAFVFLSSVAGDISGFVVLLGIFTIVMVALLFKNRERERRHQERLKAMELGAPIPPEPPPLRPRVGLLVFGVLLVSLAAAFGILSFLDPGVTGAHKREPLVPCVILGSLGIGFLISHALIRRSNGNGK